MESGCLLYPVSQEEYNGMAGMLPVGADKSNISNYNATQAFAQFVSYNQGIFKEGLPIYLHNAIDQNYAKAFAYRSNIASNLAIKLKRYGIDIQDVDDAEWSSSGTIARITGTGSAQETLAWLQQFFSIDKIEHSQATVDISGNTLSNRIDIYLGNTFMDEFGNKRFSTYLTHAQ